MAPSSAMEYDKLPYEGRPEPKTHPSRLAAVSRLFGVPAVSLTGSRVLEVGCATGANLVPMAYQVPDAEFVGFDYAPKQIEVARSFAGEVGLSNLKLEVADIREVGEAWGQFDYIIVHGIFSWIPPDVQDALLGLCRDRLKPQGIILIDYNIFPGWHLRQIVRDLIQFRTAATLDLRTGAQEGRVFLDFLASHTFYPSSPYALVLKQFQQWLKDEPISYIAHEFGSPVNHPLSFAEFANRVAAKGFDVVGDAEFLPPIPQPVGQEVLAWLRTRAQDFIQWEHYMDYFRGREFRHSVLVKQGLPISRSPVLEAFTSLFFSTTARCQSAQPQLQSNTPEIFRCADGTGFSTHNILLKNLLYELSLLNPVPVAFETIDRRLRMHLGTNAGLSDHNNSQRILCELLLQSTASGLVQMYAYPVKVMGKVTERPLASAVARAEARLGRSYVTSMAHQAYAVDAFDRALLQRLDGQQAHSSLIESLTHAWNPQWGEAASDLGQLWQHAEQRIEKRLLAFADIGLLIA